MTLICQTRDRESSCSNQANDMASDLYEDLKSSRRLPSPVGVALELLRLLEEEEVGFEPITRIIESDPAMAARLLRIANSPLSGAARDVADVGEAVRLLGLRTVSDIALGFSLVSQNRQGPCLGFAYEDFWSRSLGRAVACRRLASELKLESRNEMFVCGLLSQIGQLVFATAFPERYTSVLAAGGQGDSETLRWHEQQAFGLDHVELGVELLQDWRLSSRCCDTIRYQHATDLADDESVSRAARILNLCGPLSYTLLSEKLGRKYLVDLLVRARRLHIRADQFPDLFDSIVAEWKECAKVFQIKSRPMPAFTEICAKADARSFKVVVVVEDRREGELIERGLSSGGLPVSVEVFRDGAQAKARLDRTRADTVSARLPRPDMVLLDIDQKNVNGLDLLGVLATAGGGDLPIIVLSADDRAQQRQHARDLGAVFYLLKPREPDQLVNKIRDTHLFWRMHRT